MLYATIFNEGMLLKAAGLTKQAELSPEILDSLSLIKQDALKALGSGKLDKAALEAVADKYLADSTGFLNTHLKNAGPDAKALRKAIAESVAEVSDAYTAAASGKLPLFQQMVQQQATNKNLMQGIDQAAKQILNAGKGAAAASDPFAMYGYARQMMQQAASKGAADSVVQQAGKVGKNLHGGFGALIGSLLGGATNEGHRTSGAIGGGIGGIYGARLSQIPKLGTPGKIATGIVGATGLGYGGGKLGALLGRVLGGNE